MSQLVLQTALSWSLTYLLHSTLLLGAAWLAVRLIGNGRYAAKEWLWKTAMLGGLITSSLQVGLALDPALGRWSVFTTEPAPELAGVSSFEGLTGLVEGGGTLHRTHSGAGEVAPADVGGTLFGLGTEADPARIAFPALTRNAAGQGALALDSTWRDGLLALWTIGAMLGAALLCFAWSRIADRLAGRHELTKGPLVDQLRELTRRAQLPRRPRLCVSSRITSPATVGVFLPQILVPERATRDLSPTQQEAMLAHELAHIVRNDPQWSFFTRLIERLCFVQPLNRVARKALADIAEYQSDDWAVRHTGKELDLARCLTEVAGWRIEEREMVALLPMAGRGSQLSERVQRLLHPAPAKKPRRTSPFVLPAATLALVSTAFVMPGAAAEIDALGARLLDRAIELPVLPPETPSSTDFALELAPPTLAEELEALLTIVDGELLSLRAELDRLDTPALDPEHATTLSSLTLTLDELRVQQARVTDLLEQLSAGDEDQLETHDTPATELNR